MTETLGTPPGSSQTDNDTSTREVAKDEARSVAGDAVESGKQTASTAKEQAGQVAGEAATQAQNLVRQARDELTAQGTEQKQRAASGLRSLAGELDGMATRGDDSGEAGMATDLAREASQRVRSLAHWLESREAGDVVDEVRRFARQRPGVFLLSAAAVGFVGGRLTRGLAAQAKDEQAPSASGGAAPVSAGTSSAPAGTATGEPLAGIDTPADTGTPVVEPEGTL